MPDLEPRWMSIARREIGVAEIRGPDHEDRLAEYHGATVAGKAPDEVAWCSSFVNWILAMAEITGTRSKAALSWRKWGAKCQPIVGSIGIIKNRPWSWKGHVGFVVGQTRAGRIILLGGNQNNRVSIKSYPRKKFVGFRWPALPVMADPGVGGRTR